MITTTSYVERVLIVRNPDGTLKGAHQESLEEIRDGATILTARQLPPVPLAAETLADVLPSQSDLMAQIMSLTAGLAAAQTEKASAEATLAARTQERDALAQEKAGLEQQVQALTIHRDELYESAESRLTALQRAEQDRDAARAERDQKQSRIEELESQLDAILNPVNPPLIPTMVIRRANADSQNPRWTQLRQQSLSDPYLMTLMDWIVAAREVLTNEPIFATGVQYAIARGYVTQQEIDAWFAPVTL